MINIDNMPGSRFIVITPDKRVRSSFIRVETLYHKDYVHDIKCSESALSHLVIIPTPFILYQGACTSIVIALLTENDLWGTLQLRVILISIFS